jgi:hypothetical protein
VDFWDITKLIFRRWYVALPLLLATIAGTAYTYVSVKPDYVLTSYVQVIPPTVPADSQSNTGPRNPWALLGLGSLSQAAIYSTQDQKFLNQLAADGHSTSISITMGYPEPIVTIEVVAPTQIETETTTQLVIKKFMDSARALQAQYGARPQDMITMQRLDQGENLKTSGSKVKRALVVVAGIGILLTAALTILFDSIMRRRAKRRQAKSAQAGTEATDETAEPPARGFAADHTEVLPTGVVSLDVPTRIATGGPKAPVDSNIRYVSRQSVPVEQLVPVNPVVVEEEMSADATIVLPKVQWGPGENGGKRR